MWQWVHEVVIVQQLLVSGVVVSAACVKANNHSNIALVASFVTAVNNLSSYELAQLFL